MHELTAERLPALIDRASKRLADARTSAEVLEAKHLGDAALHYAKVTGAANETHADCLRIITRAEIRLAREIDAGQERGEIAGPGQRSNVRAPDISDLDDLGLDRRRVAEWRDLAAVGDEGVERAIDEAATEALAKKRAVTKADVRRKADFKHKTKGNKDRPPKHAVVPERPEILNALWRWLRNGPSIIGQFADHREAISIAARFGVRLNADEIREMAEFLTALGVGLEAERAA